MSADTLDLLGTERLYDTLLQTLVKIPQCLMCVYDNVMYDMYRCFRTRIGHLHGKTRPQGRDLGDMSNLCMEWKQRYDTEITKSTVYSI